MGSKNDSKRSINDREKHISRATRIPCVFERVCPGSLLKCTCRLALACSGGDHPSVKSSRVYV